MAIENRSQRTQRLHNEHYVVIFVVRSVLRVPTLIER